MVILSIIILNFNDQHYLPECLDSLKNQTFKDFEIILVDNGSNLKDYSELKSILEQYKKDLTIILIRSKNNLFFAGGNNKGIKLANGEYICLLNNDTTVNQDFIENSVKFMTNLDRFGFMGPRINFYDDKNKPRFWGSKITPLSLDFIKPLNNIYQTKARESGHAAGAALFTTKEIITKIGILDEIYFMYYEEVDWCTRARKKYNVKNYYFPGTVVYHKELLSTKEKYYKYYLHLRNIQIFVWRNYRFFVILSFYFIHYPYHILKSYIAAILRRRFNRFLIIPRAIIMGFIIGTRRKFNRVCKKQILKEYRYLKKLEKNRIIFCKFEFKG